MLTAEEVAGLAERGLFVRDGFAGEAEARAARAWAESLALGPAGVGREARAGVARGDEIAWVDEPRLRARFEALREDLNRQWLGLERFDLQVARYREGASYERHRDSFRGGPSRRVTAIWYLNEDWTHGGELRVHLDGETLDVEPRLDRLMVFLSEKIEHEVLPASGQRWAITAWYYCP